MRNKVVTIALIQKRGCKDKSQALKSAAASIEIAAKKGAQIICLQELYRTLYFPQYLNSDKNEFAETIPGESTKVFSVIAKKYKAVIIIPLFEKAKDGKYYNSAAIIDADGGLLKTYRKTHIPQDPLFYEKKYFTPSKENYNVYHTRYADFSVLICYDQWFPEAARIAALKGAQLIFYPTAIGNIAGHRSKDGDWHDAWETVMRGHAIANSAYIAAVNRVGKEDKLNFWGQSFICDPFGKVLKKAGAKMEEILICKIDLSKNLRIREGWGFFKNRRIDTYNALCRRKK